MIFFFILSVILFCFLGFLFSWEDFVDVLGFCLFFEKEPEVGRVDREGEGVWKELNKEKDMIKVLKIKKKEKKRKKAVIL